MTAFTFEGPSRAGKSTVVNILEERHPEWISFSGNSIPERASDHFEEEWRREMQFYRPVYEQNPENVFLVERQFSELAYAHNEDVRDYVKRTLAMWQDIHVIYFECGQDVLNERLSPDMKDTVEDRYEALLASHPTKVVRTDQDDVGPQDTADEVEEYIQQVME